MLKFKKDMIKIIKNNKYQVTFEKETREETWFDNKCSNENLLKQCNRENDTIDRVQWDDGEYIGSLLHIYFKANDEILIEIEEPIGKWISEQDINGTQSHNGVYYHYNDVCKLLKLMKLECNKDK